MPEPFRLQGLHGAFGPRNVTAAATRPAAPAMPAVPSKAAKWPR